MKKTCATSEGTDQPALPRSLISVFGDRFYLLQSEGYPKKDKREPLPYWSAIQADLIIFWSHRSDCRFCRALAHIIIFFYYFIFFSSVRYYKTKPRPFSIFY